MKVDLDGLAFCLNLGSSDSIVYLSVSYSVMASVFGLSTAAAQFCGQDSSQFSPLSFAG